MVGLAMQEPEILKIKQEYSTTFPTQSTVAIQKFQILNKLNKARSNQAHRNNQQNSLLSSLAFIIKLQDFVQVNHKDSPPNLSRNQTLTSNINPCNRPHSRTQYLNLQFKIVRSTVTINSKDRGTCSIILFNRCNISVDKLSTRNFVKNSCSSSEKVIFRRFVQSIRTKLNKNIQLRKKKCTVLVKIVIITCKKSLLKGLLKLSKPSLN